MVPFVLVPTPPHMVSKAIRPYGTAPPAFVPCMNSSLGSWGMGFCSRVLCVRDCVCLRI